MQIIYFKADKKTSQAIKAIADEVSQAARDAKKLFTDYGLRKFDLMSSGSVPVGIKLLDESNDSDLVKGLAKVNRNNPDVLTFKASGKTKASRDSLNALRIDAQKRLRELFGVKENFVLDESKRTMRSVVFGYVANGGVFYIQAFDFSCCRKLSGCVRISDLEYERATAKPKRKKKPLTVEG